MGWLQERGRYGDLAGPSEERQVSEIIGADSAAAVDCCRAHVEIMMKETTESFKPVSSSRDHDTNGLGIA